MWGSANQPICNYSYVHALSFHLICHIQKHFCILPSFLAAFQSLTLFFLPEHYEMTLHAYVNSVRNSLKYNIHLQLLHPVIFMVSAIFWSSPLVPKLLHFFLPYLKFKIE